MSRWIKWTICLLCVAVILAGIYLPILRRRVARAAKLQQQTAEQARRELTQAVPVNPGEPKVKAKLYWGSGNGDGTLAESVIELPLSNETVLRSKQVLNTLLAGPVDAELRTLPPDAVLLAFYLLPNGTAVADFSEALATAVPSGIQSEQMAVDSITRTLEANVPQVLRLKILIHGQEVETLAGHLDLMGTFLVSTKAVQPVPGGIAPTNAPNPTPAPATAAPPSPAKPTAPTSDKPAVMPPAKPGAGRLTLGEGPGKLAQPEREL